MFWTNTKIYLNDIVIEKRNEAIDSLRTSENIPLLLSSQKEFIKNIAECVYLGKPVLLVGSSDSGKTKLIDSYCFLSGQICNNDIIDDSVTGTFQQIRADFNYNGPDFTERMLSILFSENGKEKEIPLNCLHLWKSKVCEIYEVCWSNLYLQHSDYDISMASY
uniref:Uncharacterized protein n=1 Tax=Megaselia scalaris TaxID=36166 RepID=T1GAR5_MEGSC